VTALRLEGVDVGYGSVEVLRGLELEVGDGELVVVLGPSGSGKSTLLRVVAGLEHPTRGRVLLGGKDVTGQRAGRRNVSMVFQNYALFPHLRVLDNIAFGLEVRGTGKRESRERARQAAVSVGCGELLDRKPAQLSGGERQRVALARALVREPDAFLLDEPLSNLDAELRAQTRDELKALHARVGTTMLHVTHDQVEALILGQRVAVLNHGRIEQIGTPDEVWQTPATRFVAGFVGTPRMNFLAPNTPLIAALAPAASAASSGQLTAGIRPEAVRLGGGGAGGVGGVAGVVTQVDVVGSDCYVHLDLAGTAVTARVPASVRPAHGAQVPVHVSPADVHYFDDETGRRVEPR